MTSRRRREARLLGVKISRFEVNKSGLVNTEPGLSHTVST